MPRSWRPESENRLTLQKRSWPIHLPGLTIEETIELEKLDALPPFDDNGRIAWTFEGGPANERERRWLELYSQMLSTDRYRRLRSAAQSTSGSREPVVVLMSARGQTRQ